MQNLWPGMRISSCVPVRDQVLMYSTRVQMNVFHLILQSEATRAKELKALMQVGTSTFIPISLHATGGHEGVVVERVADWGYMYGHTWCLTPYSSQLLASQY